MLADSIGEGKVFVLARLRRLREWEYAGVGLARSVAVQKRNLKHLAWIDEKVDGVRELVGLRVALSRNSRPAKRGEDIGLPLGMRSEARNTPRLLIKYFM